MNRDPGGISLPQLRLAADAPPEDAAQLALVLGAVTELLRGQREMLECVQRLEVSLDEMHDRLEARSAPPGGVVEEDLAVSPADAARPRSAPGAVTPVSVPSEEDLLRSIQQIVGGARDEPPT